MRTTIELDADTERAVKKLRREHGRGMSEAVNELIRRGLMAPEANRRFEPRTRPLGIRIDVSNIADALDLLDGPEAR
ncbi:MAG: ribbon-helix-helix protein, CopG family [Dermatophilaceae bacterium]